MIPVQDLNNLDLLLCQSRRLRLLHGGGGEGVTLANLEAQPPHHRAGG